MPDWNQRLYTAADHAAPDVLDRVLASCAAAPQSTPPVSAPPRRRRRLPLAAAAVLAVMLCGGLGLHGWQTAHAVASTISLDVNPSIQLQVNRQEKVLSAQALNPEAREVLGDMDLRDTPLNVAVNAVIGSLLQHGYLDSLSSAILISVEDDDARRAARLETTLTEEVNAALQTASSGAAVLSQTLTHDAGLETQAQTSRISVGKAALVRQVQSLNAALDFDALAALSVEELKQLADAGAPAMPIGISAAALAAETYAGLTAVDAVLWEAEPELDEFPAHYEVELTTFFGEFEYRIDAWTGEVLRGPADVLAAQSSGGTAAVARPEAPAAVTEAEAAAIALDHAGVREADAQGLRTERDWDHGALRYEVEFWSGGTEYEYKILAADGTILKAERETHAAGSHHGAALIGEAAAQQAALGHAGVSSHHGMRCELDEDDGAFHYEVEFRSGDMAYEYRIDAVSGAVLEAESEWDD